ncbi:MAG: hypothetical protein R6V45_03350 [Oceanipulchritudo sp.]
MKKERIIEILETYRRGEGLESDQEVQQALKLAAADPDLAQLHQEIKEFDEAFADTLRSLPVPPGLYQDILDAAKQQNLSQSSPRKPAKRNKILHWLHPAAFAAAAAIILFLALSFTFWNRPASSPMNPEFASDSNGLMEATAHLYANLQPAFKSRDSAQIVNYLREKGGVVPAEMPRNLSLDQSFACDVMEVDGKTVSVICFNSPTGSGKVHLFTFAKSAFPEIDFSSSPALHSAGGSASAIWSNQDSIHVLYSSRGEENLRRILDI